MPASLCSALLGLAPAERAAGSGRWWCPRLLLGTASIQPALTVSPPLGLTRVSAWAWGPQPGSSLSLPLPHPAPLCPVSSSPRGTSLPAQGGHPDVPSHQHHGSHGHLLPSARGLIHISPIAHGVAAGLSTHPRGLTACWWGGRRGTSRACPQRGRGAGGAAIGLEEAGLSQPSHAHLWVLGWAPWLPPGARRSWREDVLQRERMGEEKPPMAAVPAASIPAASVLM